MSAEPNPTYFPFTKYSTEKVHGLSAAYLVATSESTFKEISRVRLSYGMDGMQQNSPKLSRGSAVIRCFVSLSLCMYLLGCSATHLDPAAANVTNSPGASSPGSSSGSGS